MEDREVKVRTSMSHRFATIVVIAGACLSASARADGPHHAVEILPGEQVDVFWEVNTPGIVYLGLEAQSGQARADSRSWQLQISCCKQSPSSCGVGGRNEDLLHLRVAVVIGLSWKSASARAVGLFGFSQNYLTGQELKKRKSSTSNVTIWIPILSIAGAYGHSRLSESIVAASVAPFAPNDGPGTDVSLKGKEA
jgi:hypothetical protein